MFKVRFIYLFFCLSVGPGTWKYFYRKVLYLLIISRSCWFHCPEAIVVISGSGVSSVILFSLNSEATHVYGASWWIKTRRSLFNRRSQLYIGNSVPPSFIPQNLYPIQYSCGWFFFVCMCITEGVSYLCEFLWTWPWIIHCCSISPTFSMHLYGRMPFQVSSVYYLAGSPLPFYTFYQLCIFKERIYKLYIPELRTGFLEEKKDLEETTEPLDDVFFFLICSN